MAGNETVTTPRHVQSPLMNLRGGSSTSAPRSWVALALALLIGGAFIYAGALKVWDPVKFADDISNFRILPWALGVRLAFYLPWLEILCGVALIIGWMRSGALAILTGLMVVFIGATISAKARGIDLDCGCFGAATSGLTFAWHMVIDFALLAALVALWILPVRRSAL
jgi:uncharacterized membrane protein YphA (DoxX/SURF4 family)